MLLKEVAMKPVQLLLALVKKVEHISINSRKQRSGQIIAVVKPWDLTVIWTGHMESKFTPTLSLAYYSAVIVRG